ncbi:MAG: BrnT family toxin [Gammaproteobacteria bacterium]|nr:BrnT family toxin [Gammaproteobacteria bacterium]
MDTSWDPQKARTNGARHRIAFEDAEVVLTDPFGLVREDPDALGEPRFVAVGADAPERIVTVVYAYHGDEVRLISARPATRKETDAYAKGIRLY